MPELLSAPNTHELQILSDLVFSHDGNRREIVVPFR